MYKYETEYLFMNPESHLELWIKLFDNSWRVLRTANPEGIWEWHKDCHPFNHYTKEDFNHIKEQNPEFWSRECLGEFE